MRILFDSSIYIQALRSGDEDSLLLRRWEGRSPVWLSSVVIEELYAGASREVLPFLENLERDFHKVSRTLTPTAADWAKTGKVLARIGQKYGYEQIGKAWLTNDALIATSAARTGTSVITANERDFARLAEFSSVKWQTKADFERRSV